MKPPRAKAWQDFSLSKSTLRDRLAMVVASLMLGLSVHLLHRGYFNSEWEYFGFRYFQPDLTAYFFGAVCIVLATVGLPPRLNKPSAIILQLLTTSVVVPGIVLSLGLREGSLVYYWPVVTTLSFSMLLAGILCGGTQNELKDGNAGLPGSRWELAFIGFWLATIIMLALTLGAYFTFATNLESIYAQRLETLAARSGWIGYMNSYFISICCPMLLVLGLLRRKWMLVVIGCLGYVFMYGISAERSLLITPVLILFYYVALNSRLRLFSLTAVIPAALAVAGFIAEAYWQSFSGVESFANVVLLRSIGLPGISLSLYYELFSETGYTYWSHVRGVSFFVPPPDVFQNDPLWPRLGNIIGAHYLYNPDANMNANLFSGDGLAAGGFAGLLVISAIFVVWMRWFDFAARGWNRVLVCLMSISLGVALSNAHLSTVLLSFGGIAIPALFALVKPTGLTRTRVRRMRPV